MLAKYEDILKRIQEKPKCFKPFIVNDEIARENIRNAEQGLPLTVPIRKLLENSVFYKAYKKTDKYKAYQKAYYQRRKFESDKK